MATYSSQGSRVGLVTCKVPPEPDVDEPLLLQALRSRGLFAGAVAWDDPNADWSDYDLLVLRSTWNYFEAPSEFLKWLLKVSTITRIANPAQIVEWNLHKSYLDELASQGVAIVPTIWLHRGQRVVLQEMMRAEAWKLVVVKPAISAASFETRRFSLADVTAGQQFLDRLVSTRDVMIQQYLPSIEGYGERSVVWIDGEVTHSVRKAPRFGGETEQVSASFEPEEAERRFAESAVEWVRRRFASPNGGPGSHLLYARVDLMRDFDGGIRLSELELIEPSLFLLQNPPALARFADAIVRLVRLGDSAI